MLTMLRKTGPWRTLPHAQEDPSNAIDLNGAEKKHVNGSSSGGKRRKEAHKAIEKFVACVKWFGEAMITVHSQDHLQNFLKELEQTREGLYKRRTG